MSVHAVSLVTPREKLSLVAAVFLLICAPAGAILHSADYQSPYGVIDLSELLRLIQFFNLGAFHCQSGFEDGYAPGPGDQTCAPHSSDYAPNNWRIELGELLRAIQFFNSGGYHEAEGTEDGFYPGPEGPIPGEIKVFEGIEFVWIPPGVFSMGSAKTSEEIRDIYGGDAAWYTGEHPLHTVTISQGFWMGRFEVSQAQWRAVMGDNPSAHTGESLPVESLSWDDCQAFFSILNAKETGTFRLPSEAEWEYACRAGSTTEYFFGDDMANLGGYAWYFANSDYETHPVGTKTPNAWGLYDMHGNVWEWVQDYYGSEYYAQSPGEDPHGPETGAYRVLRGGTCKRTEPKCRSAFRSWNAPGFPTFDQGFRVCREADAVSRKID